MPKKYEPHKTKYFPKVTDVWKKSPEIQSFTHEEAGSLAATIFCEFGPISDEFAKHFFDSLDNLDLNRIYHYLILELKARECL